MRVNKIRPADVRSAEALMRLLTTPMPLVAEIGCFNGEMSRRLLRLEGLRLWMVDPWGEYEVSEDYMATGDDMAFLSPGEWGLARGEAMRVVEFAKDRVTVVQKTSAEAVAELPPGLMFDMVFIDGDHSYSGTAQDIRLWWPRVHEGGWLGGHDYRSDKNFGVMQAVDEFVPRERLQLGGNFTWWVQKT